MTAIIVRFIGGEPCVERLDVSASVWRAALKESAFATTENDEKDRLASINGRYARLDQLLQSMIGNAPSLFVFGGGYKVCSLRLFLFQITHCARNATQIGFSSFVRRAVSLGSYVCVLNEYRTSRYCARHQHELSRLDSSARVVPVCVNCARDDDVDAKVKQRFSADNVRRAREDIAAGRVYNASDGFGEQRPLNF